MSDELSTIKRKIAENKEYLKQTYGVDEIGIFGSYVRGDNSPLSDIDVLFSIDEKRNDTISVFDLVDMKSFLENKLEKTVDLVEKKGIKPFYKDQVLFELVTM